MSAAHDVFDSDWLRLREPVDHRSRHADLTDRAARAGAELGWRGVLDLGGGTGSNVRYLAPRMPWARTWTVLDHDTHLLAEADAPEGAVLRRVEGSLEGEGLEGVAEADLVTASAVLDLVSRPWLEALAERCAAARCGVLFALSYDGTIRFEGSAPDPDDDFVRTAVNRHQTGEKGMGPALGPQAADVARALWESVGYDVRTAPSPWILQGPNDGELAARLMAGWVGAAMELHPGARERLRRWLDRRTHAFDERSLRIVVGHLDVLGLPPRTIR